LNNHGAGRSKGKAELRTWEYEGEIKRVYEAKVVAWKERKGRDERGRKGCVRWIKGGNLKRNGESLR
jgi:hypothetical protein